MSKAINFSARDFNFDNTCNDNVGSRMFAAGFDGNNIEQFEIGDWNWSWTQIRSERLLEKNTDYLFRFAMTGGYNDTDDAVSQFIILFDDDWENRYVYPLDKSRYNPAVSKRIKDDLLRVFEIPFNTGNAEKTTFLFIAQHAVARFFTPLEISAYSELEDFSYEQWHTENRDRINSSCDDSCDDMTFEICNTNLTAAEFSMLLNNVGDGGHISFNNCNISGTESNMSIESFSDEIDAEMHNCKMTAAAFSLLMGKAGNDSCITLENTVITDEGINKMLCKGRDGVEVELNNCTLPDDMKKLVKHSFGEASLDFSSSSSSCGVSLNISKKKLSEKTLAEHLLKFGDNSALEISDCSLSAENDETDEFYNIGNYCCGSSIKVIDSDMTAKAFSMLILKAGDGCSVNFENCNISSEGIGTMYYHGRHCVGTLITVSNCHIPSAAAELIKNSFEIGCVLNMPNTDVVNDD